MSSSSAIAVVTSTLKVLLGNGLADADRNHSGITRVTTLSPGLLKGDVESGINLFLCDIVESPQLSNSPKPGPGEVGRQSLAIDLLYLLTAYGKKDFEAELLLGCAIQTLYEHPILTNETINSSLRQTEPNLMSTLDLTQDAHLMRVSLKSMNIVEMSQVWLAFQVPHRPSVMYSVSPVLIDHPRLHK